MVDWRRKLLNFMKDIAEAVFKRYKDKVKYWMTFNEINNQMDIHNPLFLWTYSGVTFEEGENRKQITFQAVHHEFVASAKAVKQGHEINPDFKIGCMIAYMPAYP